MYKRIVLAYDGSVSGQKALLDGQEFADLTRSEVYLIAVMPPPSALVGGEGSIYDAKLEEEEKKEYQGILDEGLRRLEASGHVAKGQLMVGDAVDEIVAYAKKVEADLIVVGHKHLDRWIARWWRGSLSKSLIENAPCNVLVVITR
jgi:nucleotide-binding universal stress UspA family protein